MDHIRRLTWCSFVLALLSGYGVAAQTESVPESAKKVFAEGLRALQKNDCQRALICFDKAIQLAPKWEPAYFCRGDVHLRNDEYEKAISDFSAFVELAPSNFSGYAWRGFAYARAR